jgi:SagB-type dehydrogenase family enzyme
MTLSNEAWLKTSSTLLALPMSASEEGAANIGLYNFLTKSFATCSIEFMYWLSYFFETKTIAKARKDHEKLAADDFDCQISALLDLGFITQNETPQYADSEAYRKSWGWDTLAGAFHFSLLNNAFMSADESTEFQRNKLDVTPAPASAWCLSGLRTIQLPAIDDSQVVDHLNLLARRRTNRTSAGHALTLQELSACLFGAFAILGHVGVTSGQLPLSCVPSGGARNPYEAYVILRRCDGAEPGIYHYCGLTHALSKITDLPNDLSVADLVCGQQWAEDMAAVVVMTAVLERSMWKYQDSNAYRVILIEAGHRAQNLMTAATRLGLTACPTAALSHAALQRLLMLTDPMLHVPVYAVTLDKALPNQDQVIWNEATQRVIAACY